MIRVYHDWEFLEDGKTIDVISGAMVAEDGSYLEVYNGEHDRDAVAAHPWLRANVLPHLPYPDSPLWSSRKVVAEQVKAYLLGLVEQHGYIELWAWYAAYDHVALAQLFGPMVDLPDGIPMYTRDLKHFHDDLGCPELPAQPDKAHDALADARHNWARWAHMARIRKAWSLYGRFCGCAAEEETFHDRGAKLAYDCTRNHVIGLTPSESW